MKLLLILGNLLAQTTHNPMVDMVGYSQMCSEHVLDCAVLQHARLLVLLMRLCCMHRGAAIRRAIYGRRSCQTTGGHLSSPTRAIRGCGGICRTL